MIQKLLKIVILLLYLQVRYKTSKKEVNCWVQVGIVSWGFGCGQAVNRTQPIPGFYTNVLNYTSWINFQMQNFTENGVIICTKINQLGLKS